MEMPALIAKKESNASNGIISIFNAVFLIVLRVYLFFIFPPNYHNGQRLIHPALIHLLKMMD